MSPHSIHDVAIVGGGPAGLSAALLLGRCLRSVVLCDAGRPRNERSPAMHGFLGSDGVNPREFLERCRAQLGPYRTVELIRDEVVGIEKDAEGFLVSTSRGHCWLARAVLLSTGLVDQLPEIVGFEDFYGVSIHSCPYCDGWEERGKRIGVLGYDKPSLQLALELQIWSNEVTVYTGQQPGGVVCPVPPGATFTIVEGEIERLNGHNGRLEEIHTATERHPCDSLFFSPLQSQHSALAVNLGCEVAGGEIVCANGTTTGIEGLFVAGNASKGLQMAIVAAAEGTKAAAAINDWLISRGSSYLCRYDDPSALSAAGS